MGSGSPGQKNSRQKHSILIVFSLLSVLLGSNGKPCDAAAGRNGESKTCEGRVVPRDFLALCAPQNTLRLPFWRSESNSIRLATILPESRAVKAGDVVATFQFADVSARAELTQQVDRLKAKRDETLLGLRKNLVDLEARLEKARLRERLAEIDLGRKSSVSAQKATLLDCEARLAAHERASLEHKVAAARDNLKRTGAILEGTIRGWENHFASFDRTRDRYSVKAPADGFLFYPVIEKLKRKIQVGDEINSGVHFLSVVTSDRVEIQFFLPERELDQVQSGATVRVMCDGRELPAAVRGIGFFPLRIGDVQGTYSLPDAWEKCFVVKADLRGTLRLGTNNTVRVRLGR